VEQNAAILDGTLRDNLTYANPKASTADIDEALELACLRSWVDRLPAGQFYKGADGRWVKKWRQRKRKYRNARKVNQHKKQEV